MDRVRQKNVHIHYKGQKLMDKVTLKASFEENVKTMKLDIPHTKKKWWKMYFEIIQLWCSNHD